MNLINELNESVKALKVISEFNDLDPLTKDFLEIEIEKLTDVKKEIEKNGK